jgi:uncharacterized membrane protein
MNSKTQRTLFGAGLMVTIILMAAIAGFFYAYQVSVIWGLDAVEPKVAIRAMQGINAEVRNFWFAPSFFGSLVAPIAMLGVAWLSCQRTDAAILAGVALLYATGAFALTLWWSVPLNVALAQVTIPADTDEAAQVWQRYRDAWMIGNSLRTVTAFVALGLLVWIPMRRQRVGD